MRVARWGPGTDQSKSIGTSRGNASDYTDPARFRLERERLLRRTWHVAGRVDQLAAPRDLLVWERFGQSIVIARQDDGSLSAFHNVCRHRSVRLVRTSGPCASGRIVCPFHRWMYDLEGRLTSVPERETFDPAHLEGLRAAPAAVEVFEGWIFVHPDPAIATPLAAFLGELADELRWYGMGDWKVYGSSSWVADANWKVVLEAFLESWHTPTVHRESAPRGFDVARSTFATFDPHSMMVVPLTALNIDSAPEPVEHRRYADCQYLIFPTAFLNMFPDQGYLVTVCPIDADRTLCEGHIVARRTPPRGVDPTTWEASVQSSRGVMERIMREDLGISSEIAAVKDSFANDGNRYNSLECRITAFHHQIERFIRS